MVHIDYDTVRDKAQAIRSALPDVLEKSKHGRYSFFKVGAGFDCETTKTPKGYAYVYIWQFAINQTVFTGRTVDTCETFLRQLDDILQKMHRSKVHGKIKNYPKLLIFDANLGYEFSFFKYVFDRIGITNQFAKNERHPLFVTVGQCLHFRECLGVFGYSLGNIAENWTKTQKMKNDLGYDIPRNSLTDLTPTEWGYVYNDVLILSELGFVAFDKYEGQPIPCTGTGIIRNADKEQLKSRGKLTMDFEKEKVSRLMPHNLDDYHAIMDFLYCGGLCHSYFDAVQRELCDVVCADIVSDFPAQMTHRSFPAGSCIGNRTYEDLLNAKHWYALCTFYDVKPKTKHSIVSMHKCIELYHPTIDNGRIFAAEVMSVYCTEVDFANIGLIYDIDSVEFSDIHIFTQSAPCPQHLLNVLWSQYEIKAKLKKPKKEAENKLKEDPNRPDKEECRKVIRAYDESKKFVNGCYGMTSTRIYETQVQFGINPENDRQEYPDLYTGKRLNDKTGKPLTYNEMIKDLWLSPWIAIYTTAYARQILVKLIAKYPELIVQYDTDSIYFLDGRPRSEELRADLLRHNAEWTEKNNTKFANNPLFADLGTWEFDPKIDKFKCLGAKRYLKQTGKKIKLVCAGCKEDAFIKHCETNNLDPFEFFDKWMKLPPDSSGKTTLRYYPKKDKPYCDTIADEQGHTQKVEIECCAVITDIPFNLFMSQDWLLFLNMEQSKTGRL